MLLSIVAQPSANRTAFTDRFGQNLIGPLQGCLNVRNVLTDKFSSLAVQIISFSHKDPVGKRLQALFPGNLCLGAAFFLIRQVQVFNNVQFGSRFNLHS